jgi:3-oxoacyl-[acyl-carrier protein] reductase
VTSRTVLVTGASRGIGNATAETLREHDWAVLAPTRSELDLNSPDAVELFLKTLSSPIDGLVLNAGINQPSPLVSQQVDEWDEIQQINVGSSMQLVRGLLPQMVERGFGRIVAITSLYADRARPGRGAYGASKAALGSLMRTIAVEHGQSNIVANCVAPGFVDTELTRQNNAPEILQTLIERVPVGRLAESWEVARAVVFLMSPSNQYITGQTLVIDGGYSCL